MQALGFLKGLALGTLCAATVNATVIAGLRQLEDEQLVKSARQTKTPIKRLARTTLCK